MAAFYRIKLLRLKILTLYLLCTLSRSHLVQIVPPLFVIVFSDEANRSSLSQMFFKIGILKNLTNFIKKYQCWSIFLTRLQAWRPVTLLKRDSTKVFFCKICNISKNIFF